MKKDRIIEVKPPHIQLATILIEGDSDLVLNKKHARTIRSLTETKKGKKTVKETPNVWEDILLRCIGVMATPNRSRILTET